MVPKNMDLCMLNATFKGLPTSNKSAKDFETFKENVENLIEFGINSFVGFMFTTIFDVLAEEAIEHNCRCWIKAIFYWLCVVFYICSCMMFSLAIRYFMFAQFFGRTHMTYSYLICITLFILTALDMRSYLCGWL